MTTTDATLERWRADRWMVEWFVDELGAGELRACRNVVDGVGVDPGAVRAAVLTHEGAEMTPFPDFHGLCPVEIVRDELITACPLWTENGPSQLVLEVRTWSRDGFTQVCVSRVADDTGRTVTTEADAPASAHPRSTEYEPTPYRPGVDPRIRRAAFVGSSARVLVRQLVNGVFAALGSEAMIGHLDEMTPGQRALLELDFSVGDILNGGLHQFYSNSTGDLAERLPSAARLLDLPELADIVERANALFPIGALADRDDRNAALDDPRFDEAALDRLTNELYNLGNLDRAVLRFIQRNPEQFFRP